MDGFNRLIDLNNVAILLFELKMTDAHQVLMMLELDELKAPKSQMPAATPVTDPCQARIPVKPHQTR